jgi:large conductance mechanosensitive channel
MSILQEFKEFALKGNVVDLAVGVIIGAGFGKITTSLVEDVIMPPVGWLIGGVNFTDLVLKFPATMGKAEVAIKYGNFLQVIFDFAIVAFCVFLLVKGMNSLKKQPAPVEAVPAAPPRQEVLLEEILNALKTK